MANCRPNIINGRKPKQITLCLHLLTKFYISLNLTAVVYEMTGD